MIIVFARAPVPGAAKTRLIPALGEWGAARLHTRLVRHAVRTALASGCGPVEVHGTARHSFFRSLKIPFRLQRGRGLGERMHHALSRSPGAILIGTDCPALTAADLRRALRLLRGGAEVVIAPAEDGGYALIGARRVPAELFREIAWGSSSVYDETVTRLKPYRWRALRTVWDVDRPEDLERFRWLRFSSAGRPRVRR
ncbi:MAG TPA: TIGR04282 family arsenosugar biosynthesis glycosyltransferase [Burkholderiales bacterium]|nr:TIGR04282 family arsenosugar biosynthesis glycosyltransferase [Burkholderiales bacterium]